MATKGNGCSDPERQKIIDLMLENVPSLRAFAISLSHNVSRADDLVQQTLLQALTNLESFVPGTNMAAWLFTILRNRFRSDYRKKRESEWNPEFENSMAFSTGMGEGAETACDFQRMLLCLACLPPDQADALIAVGYMGISYEESAERLGCEVGTIKSRVNRARVELASLIEGGVLVHVDLSKLKTATRGVPHDHAYYPIAKAYEELYAESKGISKSSNGKEHTSESSESEKRWEELVASGALDDNSENLEALLQGSPQDF